MQHVSFYRLDPKRVRSRIRDLDLKQWWVAEEAGIHKSTLRRWLNGKIERATSSRVHSLARVLGTSEREFAQPADDANIARN